MDNNQNAVNGADSDEKNNPKPRDARLIHALLASQGVTSYQERVPLMLIDFAYRYTRGVLSDAATLAAEGYGTQDTRTTGKAAATQDDINMTSLRLAVASRQISQFQPSLGKPDLLEMAAETNKIGLPRVEREFGVRLPSEKYLFTGSGFVIPEEWEEEVLLGDGEVENQDTVMQDNAGLLNDEDVDEDEFEEVMGSQDQKMGGT